MKKSVWFVGAAIAPLWVIAGGASAQTADAVNPLDELVVVGARTPTKVSDIPAATVVLSEAQIQQQARAGVPLKELLGALVPGLDVGPQGRTNYGQNLRGRSAQVMIDGVTLNQSRSLSRQFDSIDPFNIVRVEVLSGATAVYGGGATGGIINIVTKRGQAGPPQFELEAGLRTGFEGGDLDKRFGAAVSGGSETLNGRLALAVQKNGPAYDADGERIKPDITQTDLQENLSTDIQGEVNWTPAEGHQLRVFGQIYDSAYDGDDALYLGPNLAGALAGRTDLLEVRSGFSSDLEPSTKRKMGSIDYSAADVLGGQSLLLQVYGRTEESAFYPFPGTASFTVGGVRRNLNYYGASKQNTDLFGVKSALTKSFGDLSVTYGFDYAQETFDAQQVLFNTATAFASGGMNLVRTAEVGRYPSFEVKTPALYAQLEWKPTANLTLAGGLRHEKTKVKVDDFVAFAQQVLVANGVASGADAVPGGSNDYDVTLVNLGAVYTFAERAQAWANYSEGFDLPDPAKYYGTGIYTLPAIGGRFALVSGVDVEGQPLSGIKTKQIEGGTRFTVGSLNAQAALFYALSDKTIRFTAATLNILMVDQEVRTYGLEGFADYGLGDGWSVGVSGLAVASEQKTAGSWKKQTVTLASPSKLNAYVAKSFENGSLRLQSSTTFDLKDDVGGRLEGYTTVDLLGEAKVGPGRLSIGVQNLLNEDYTTIWGQRAVLFYSSLVNPAVVTFKGRGRTFGLSYDVAF
ncbi:MAG: TonB-dependent receptor [Phenylobacterium sp.]|nr:TonB-dependent receptor [Phenylobacterium sp.]